jgi:opacity protein-like surface antigen
MMKTNTRLRHVILVIGCLALSSSVFAQDFEQRQIETTGQIGVVSGIGTHTALAGSVGTAITPKILAFGEFGWIPTGGSSITSNTPGNAFSFDSSSRVLSLMGGVQYQFKKTHSLVPYGTAGLGLVRASGDVTQTVGGTTSQFNSSSNNLYVSLGAGARYYVKTNWGFKPEITVFAGNDSFVRVGAGVFYQFSHQ